ncbi:hypothetical protein VTO73DRAFT_2102 [Trametes versicolor]
MRSLGLESTVPTSSRAHAASWASDNATPGSMYQDGRAPHLTARSEQKIFTSSRSISWVDWNTKRRNRPLRVGPAPSRRMAAPAHSAAPGTSPPPLAGMCEDVARRGRRGAEASGRLRENRRIYGPRRTLLRRRVAIRGEVGRVGSSLDGRGGANGRDRVSHDGPTPGDRDTGQAHSPAPPATAPTLTGTSAQVYFSGVVAELGRLCLENGNSGVVAPRHHVRVSARYAHTTCHCGTSLLTEFGGGGSSTIPAVPRTHRLLWLRSSVHVFADASVVASAVCKAARRLRRAAGPCRAGPVPSPPRPNGSPQAPKNKTAGVRDHDAHALHSAPRSEPKEN